MKSSSQSSSHRKPVGGVRSVRLCSAKNIQYVDFGSDATCYRKLEFCDEDEVMSCQLCEEASSLEEILSFDGGRVAVQHTLILVAERNQSAVWLEAAFCREAMQDGLCAEVELNDGRRLLVGYSERFGAQQSLRIKEIRSLSGRTLLESPTIAMTLESYDTSAAVIYTSN